jgi:hypothetical protein
VTNRAFRKLVASTRKAQKAYFAARRARLARSVCDELMEVAKGLEAQVDEELKANPDGQATLFEEMTDND